MRIGLQFSRFDFPGGTPAIGPGVAAVARTAEEAGFASFWVMDHFYQIEMIGSPEEPMMEGYSTLAFAAGATERIQLGTMVTGATYRYPGVLVKTVTTLDVLSGGRAYLGIGAGWYEREHAGLGVPFPPTAERFERLEEILQITKQMWSGEVKPYDGKHVHLTETLCRPLPISQPHPPILIGGGGERKTLRLVARYADACNLFDSPELAHKLEVLRGHCEAEGRPYGEIEKTVLTGLPVGRGGTMSPAQAIEHLGRLGELGIDQVLVGGTVPGNLETIDVLGSQVIPETTNLAVAGR